MCVRACVASVCEYVSVRVLACAYLLDAGDGHGVLHAAGLALLDQLVVDLPRAEDDPLHPLGVPCRGALLNDEPLELGT